MFVFDWVRWACSVWENFCWNLLAFWLWLFLLNLSRFDCQIFLKGSCCLSFWTELCAVPVSVSSFSRRVATSVAKYLLISVFKSVSRSYFCFLGSPTIFLLICLLGDTFCLSWALIMSAKSFWRGPADCLFGLSSVPFLSLCRASVAGLQRLLPSIS